MATIMSINNQESDNEIKEDIKITTPPPIFSLDSSSAHGSSEDSNSPDLVDLFDNISLSEVPFRSKFEYPPFPEDCFDDLDYPHYTESFLRNSAQYPTPSPWSTGGIMSAYISGGSGYSSSISSAGHYRGNGLTNLRDQSANSGGSSSDGSPPLLLSPGIYQHNGEHGQLHNGQYNGNSNANGGMGCGVQRSNSLPFELNGREVTPGLQGSHHDSNNSQLHESVYLGPVSHSGSIGTNGRIPPSVRLAMGLNDARRKQKVKYNFCVFCKNNGEDEKVYMSHTLKHDNGTIRCPILYNYECPLCGATGPVSHTIRYCPSSKGKQQVEEIASITQLKQMRSSTGRLRASSTNNASSPIQAYQMLGANPCFQTSSSVAAARQFYNPQQQVAVCNTLAQGQSNMYSRPVLGQGYRNRDTNYSTSNLTWTGSSNQPCIPPMYGEYVNSQNRQRCNYEGFYQPTPKALAQSLCQTQQPMSMSSQVITSQAK